ncbi:hypothetical protein C8R47DRAFT_1261092 [Mycena vitilis]|nr:hypothetical protein C8R47DRAFT_1261092 [Mycena vitilis]
MSSSKSQHQVAGGKGLKVEHLRHLLRIHLKKGALRPTPLQYEDAAQLIADNESFGVNWTYVLHQTGPHTAVDVKMAEFYARKVIVPPPDIDLEPPSSPLTEDPDVPMEAETRVQNIRMPTPMPTTRCTVWRGTSEELDRDPTILWKMLSFDAGSDVKTMDPRVVVVNRLDDEENMVKRYHHLDLTDIIQYHGLTRPGHETEGLCADSDLETFSSDYLITAALFAKPTIERIIYRHAPFHTEGIPYQVFHSLPGHGYEVLHGPLLTYHPDDVPNEKWAKDMDNDKLLPAIGAPDALRVLLYVKPYELPFEEISAPERVNRLAAAYLLEKHGDMPLLKEVRRHNSDPLLKKSDQGRSPHKWDQWVGMMSTIFEYEAKVPESCDNEARGKLINIIQMSKLVFMQTDWVSKCLKAAKGIDGKWGRAVNKPLRDYLLIDTGSIGIEPFLKKVEGSDSEVDLLGKVDASKQHRTRDRGRDYDHTTGLFGYLCLVPPPPRQQQWVRIQILPAHWLLQDRGRPLRSPALHAVADPATPSPEMVTHPVSTQTACLCQGNGCEAQPATGPPQVPRNAQSASHQCRLATSVSGTHQLANAPVPSHLAKFAAAVMGVRPRAWGHGGVKMVGGERWIQRSMCPMSVRPGVIVRTSHRHSPTLADTRRLYHTPRHHLHRAGARPRTDIARVATAVVGVRGRLGHRAVRRRRGKGDTGLHRDARALATLGVAAPLQDGLARRGPALVRLAAADLDGARRVRVGVATPQHDEDENDDGEPLTPHTRRRSFLLSVINSTARPHLKLPTPHPRKVQPAALSDETPEATPRPRLADLGTSALRTAFAGATPRMPRHSSHPLVQTYIPSPGTSDSEFASASASAAGAPWATPGSGSSPHDGASIISTTSSHDLTTHHYRTNTSFDPVMGFGATQGLHGHPADSRSTTAAMSTSHRGLVGDIARTTRSHVAGPQRTQRALGATAALHHARPPRSTSTSRARATPPPTSSTRFPSPDYPGMGVPPRARGHGGSDEEGQDVVADQHAQRRRHPRSRHRPLAAPLSPPRSPRPDLAAPRFATFAPRGGHTVRPRFRAPRSHVTPVANTPERSYGIGTELTPTTCTPGSPSPECAGARCARSHDPGSVQHRARVHAPQNSNRDLAHFGGALRRCRAPRSRFHPPGFWFNVTDAASRFAAAVAASQLIGSLLNYFLYGILAVQVYVYRLSFPNDKAAIKWMVYTIFVVETVMTALNGVDIYHWFAEGFGDIVEFAKPLISPA